jgi:hypothetical protein
MVISPEEVTLRTGSLQFASSSFERFSISVTTSLASEIFNLCSMAFGPKAVNRGW